MCDITPIEMARLMRGKVPEWDETYLEKYIPPLLLSQLLETDKWIDEDRFHWGFCYVYASKLRETNENIIVVATKPWGQGENELKVIVEDGSLMTIWANMLI